MSLKQQLQKQHIRSIKCGSVSWSVLLSVLQGLQHHREGSGCSLLNIRRNIIKLQETAAREKFKNNILSWLSNISVSYRYNYQMNTFIRLTWPWWVYCWGPMEVHAFSMTSCQIEQGQSIHVTYTIDYDKVASQNWLRPVNASCSYKKIQRII